MTLFFSLLPIYLLGNLHCLGMCGPLVMLIGKHRFGWLYFLGRLSSFTLAGLFAGYAGEVLQGLFQNLGLSFVFSGALGLFLLFLGIVTAVGAPLPFQQRLSSLLAPVNRTISFLILRNSAWPLFLFGFLTVALPCGQTMIVFSACALFGDPTAGAVNGLAFALLTSPALFFAMRAQSFLRYFRKWEGLVLGGCSATAGILALCRAFAERGWIDHLVVFSKYHIILY